MRSRGKKIILAAAIIASTSLLLVLFQSQNLTVPGLATILSTPPDLSFLKSFGLDISFGELSPGYLLVLSGAACLFLMIGVGLGRIGSRRKESASAPAPPAMKAAPKSHLTRLVSRRKIDPQTDSSAEQRLRRLLEQA